MTKAGTDGPTTGLPAAQGQTAFMAGLLEGFIERAKTMPPEQLAMHLRGIASDMGPDRNFSAAAVLEAASRINAPQAAAPGGVAPTPSKYCEYCGTPKDYFQHPDPCPRAPIPTDLVEENKRLREALEKLAHPFAHFGPASQPGDVAHNYRDLVIRMAETAQATLNRTALRNGEPG